MLRRLEGQYSDWVHNPVVEALGGIEFTKKGKYHVHFVREDFEHESLAHNDQICDHLGEFFVCADPLGTRSRIVDSTHQLASKQRPSSSGNSTLISFSRIHRTKSQIQIQTQRRLQSKSAVTWF